MLARRQLERGGEQEIKGTKLTKVRVLFYHHTSARNEHKAQLEPSQELLHLENEDCIAALFCADSAAPHYLPGTCIFSATTTQSVRSASLADIKSPTESKNAATTDLKINLQ
jgi:hypothetical protein